MHRPGKVARFRSRILPELAPELALSADAAESGSVHVSLLPRRDAVVSAENTEINVYSLDRRRTMDDGPAIDQGDHWTPRPTRCRRS